MGYHSFHHILRCDMVKVLSVSCIFDRVNRILKWYKGCSLSLSLFVQFSLRRKGLETKSNVELRQFFPGALFNCELFVVEEMRSTYLNIIIRQQFVCYSSGLRKYLDGKFIDTGIQFSPSNQHCICLHFVLSIMLRISIPPNQLFLNCIALHLSPYPLCICVLY